MAINKIIGLVILIFGAYTLRHFPDLRRYQRPEITSTGILIGVILSLVGLGLLIFG